MAVCRSLSAFTRVEYSIIKHSFFLRITHSFWIEGTFPPFPSSQPYIGLKLDQSEPACPPIPDYVYVHRDKVSLLFMNDLTKTKTYKIKIKPNAPIALTNFTAINQCWLSYDNHGRPWYSVDRSPLTLTHWYTLSSLSPYTHILRH
jgi:hypothetical protein